VHNSSATCASTALGLLPSRRTKACSLCSHHAARNWGGRSVPENETNYRILYLTGTRQNFTCMHARRCVALTAGCRCWGYQSPTILAERRGSGVGSEASARKHSAAPADAERTTHSLPSAARVPCCALRCRLCVTCKCSCTNAGLACSAAGGSAWLVSHLNRSGFSSAHGGARQPRASSPHPPYTTTRRLAEQRRRPAPRQTGAPGWPPPSRPPVGQVPGSRAAWRGTAGCCAAAGRYAASADSLTPSERHWRAFLRASSSALRLAGEKPCAASAMLVASAEKGHMPPAQR